MAQQVVPWETGITATWDRANELIKLSYHPLTIDLVEEGTGQQWRLTFGSWQALRVTTEECIYSVDIPGRGGFFEVLDSGWIHALGKGRIHFLEPSRHFIVCCYEEMIEIVAHDYEIMKRDEEGDQENQ